MKRMFKFSLKWLIILIMTFGFLAMCNWSYHLASWNGFSRFILGAEGIIFLLDLFHEI
jgi:hypothetical protein